MGAQDQLPRRRHVRGRAFHILGAGVLAAVVLTACDIPRQMQVRAGVDPEHEDDFVRFRTIYYFRTFNLCPGSTASGTLPNGRTDSVFGGKNPSDVRILSDSLYRFQMTGKAASLFTKVHFESGTLRKEQIDPFGATAVFDSKSNRFFFQSHEDNQRAAARARDLKEIAELAELAKDPNLASNKAAITSAIDTVVARLGTNVSAPAAAASPSPATCPNGQPSQQGFQILGPQGWRTFDPGERLLMAMSSSAKPLVSTLQEFSSNILAAQPNRADVMLPLVQERLRISEAQRQLDGARRAPSDDPATAIQNIVASFERP